MKRSQSIVGLMFLVAIGYHQGAIAQVTSDGSLTTPTLVPPSMNGKDFLINNGTRSGNNLFHSFSQFSIPTTGSAIFNNATDIQNIFSRVTGSQVSNIDGVLKTQGNASLFLMNPNGILFGPNAKLDLGGSFVGTTASSIKFEDGIAFSAVNTAANPLLSVKVPIGLQMGGNPASIVVQGTGNHITATDYLFTPYQSLPSSNLQVNSSATLALVGGKIEMQGSRLNAGHLEISAIDSSSLATPIVGLKAIPQGWTLSYSHVPQFGDIHLSQGSLLDANSGSIQIQGRNIGFQDGSLAWVQNQSDSAAGAINVKASGLLSFQGTTAQARVRSGLESQSLGIGKSGDISVLAHDITITDGAGIVTRSFGKGATGNITISATGHVQAKGFTMGSNENSTIASFNLGSGNAGNLQVTANRLTLLDAGNINNATFKTGSAGKVSIDVMTAIEIGGFNPLTQSVSTIGGSSFGSGNAGSVNINTARLLLRNNSRVSSGSFSKGNGGIVVVNATDFVELTGKGTAIRSAIEILPPVLRTALGLPPSPSGNAGSVTIHTPLLRISDKAQVSVRNQGNGNAGKVQIQANKIELTQQGDITANTAFGEGGDIELRANVLLLREGSMIATNASGQVGRGGNIEIDSPVIVGLGNSDIIANSVKGNGGNITIKTQGLFGLKYRDRLTSNNDITASSEFGINGNVQVNMIGINPTNALNKLPVDVVDSSGQITDRCGDAKTSSFVATGRGGIPQNPMKKRSSDRSWHDLRTLTFTNPVTTQPTIAENPISRPIVEANAVQIDKSGAIVLVAKRSPMSVNSYMTCSLGNDTSH
jgi:filamentous hemagglutinin family protein